MSDAIGKDTPEEATNGDTLDKTQADTGGEKATELILGKYKDMDAVENALKSSEQRMHEATAEAASLKEKAGLTDAITKLAEVSEARDAKPDDSEEKFKAKLAEIAEDYRENPDVAVEKQMALTNAWIADEGSKLKASTTKEIAELRTSLVQMQALMGDRDPVYLENKAVVDNLVENGMPKENAIAWAKANAPEETQVRPANMSGASIRKEEVTGTWLTPEDRARMKAVDGLDDGDLDSMEAQHWINVKRGK